MTDTAKTLTTTEFAKRCGRSASTITKMLRQGRLKGEKRGGRWAIFETELAGFAESAETADTMPARPDQKTTTSQAEDKKYPIETFVKMTYLTEKGVRQFLRNGRLSGSIDDNGQWVVDADNLQRPGIKHLIRQ